ncbi:MAG TPA: RdgB/HAM1 family non-canonical purine NTP pyrophosphatase [Candidatus Ornithoclostridium faecigallinarum]|nr:RdgB/HAM1 family non-canonical purine NTP pyrophosphatase [Candidatus Ornithoclostridium faecigallinarum]
MSNERICVLASHNAHKLAEIRAILADEFDKVLSLKDVGIEVDIDETGTTFEQNAYIKAKAIADLLPGYAVVADDSGLCVPCLNGEPGVYSARYAGEVCDDHANNRLLLHNLHEREKTLPRDRNAYFVSAVVLLFPDGRYISGEGRVDGTILDEYRGNGGFGYDPLFLCTELNKTFAEATAGEKNSVSHRARALAELKRKLHA